ncbi:vascular cell adhesion protein 1-like [Clarias gariepinus]
MDGPTNTLVSASPSASVVLGSSVSLSCSSDANPAVLNYTWYRENGEQKGTGDHLTINTTDSTHSGLYYCRAQNQYGDHNSSVYLDVQYAPQVSPSSSCSITQDLIMCSCEVHGNPSPKLKWRLSNQHSPTSRDESVNNTTLRSFISISQSFTHMLTVQCVGSSRLGTDTQIYIIKMVHHSAKEHRHTAVLYLGLSVVLLVSLGVIGFLIYRLKQLSRKIKIHTQQYISTVLEGGDTYASLQLSAVQNSEYETLQTNREGRETKNKD